LGWGNFGFRRGRWIPWVIGGVAIGLSDSIYADYCNPYCENFGGGSAGDVIDPALAGYDYTQPLGAGDAPGEIDNPNALAQADPNAIPNPNPGANPAPNANPPANEEGVNAMEQAVDAFKAGNYPLALQRVAVAVKLMPQDPDVHQLRSLILFAQKDYKSSAAAAHVAITGGPGWNWDELNSLYSDQKIYTAQYRALQQFVVRNPQLPEGHFLLAYHYLMLGHVDAARGELTIVVRLQPKDVLAARILQAITPKQEENRKAPAQQPTRKPQPKLEPVPSDLPKVAAKRPIQIPAKSPTDTTPHEANDPLLKPMSEVTPAEETPAEIAPEEPTAPLAPSIPKPSPKLVPIPEPQLPPPQSVAPEAPSDEDAPLAPEVTENTPPLAPDSVEITPLEAPAVVVPKRTAPQAAIPAPLPVVKAIPPGTWKASPDEGVRIELTINANGTFAWSYTADKETTKIKGTYQIKGSELTLTDSENGEKVEAIIVLKGAGKGLSFRYKDAPEDEPAIEFER